MGHPRSTLASSHVGVVVALLVGGCQSNSAAQCNCPDESGITVSVPASRASDVKSVRSTGAFDGAGKSTGDGQWQILTDAAGKDHIVVTFNDGTEYTDDVTLSHCAIEPCCSVCSPLADHVVKVPASGGTTADGG
ncbi:MAG TPA: hypothetical protein VH062_19295 [Polyangiaceae bacterium]|jgi:hypothetical protein|nr:hypothetical protein [Polyangiaceae bacterium]